MYCIIYCLLLCLHHNYYTVLVCLAVENMQMQSTVNIFLKISYDFSPYGINPNTVRPTVAVYGWQFLASKVNEVYLDADL